MPDPSAAVVRTETLPTVMSLGPDFLLFLTGSTLSATGTAMVPVALSFALLGTGHSPMALGLVLAAQAVPNVVLLLLGGVIGDRWPRKRIMIGADLLCFVAQSLLALVLLQGKASLLSIIVLTALVGAGMAFFYPARGGLVAGLVPKERLARANGALTAMGSIAAVVGPALAGLLVAAVGPGWAIGLDGLSYAASALCLLSVRGQGGTGQAKTLGSSLLQELRGGLGAFANRRWLWLIVGQFGLLNLVAFAPVLVLAPVLLARAPHAAQHWGLLLSAAGLGGLVGAAAIMHREPVRTGIAIEAAVVLLVTPLILLAVNAALPILLVSGVAYGAGEAVVNVLIGTMVQREIPEELLSRVFSIVQITAGVLTPLGFALAGPAAMWFGLHEALLAGAGLSLASAALLICSPDIRRLKSHISAVLITGKLD